jgi:hypothetical protein
MRKANWLVIGKGQLGRKSWGRGKGKILYSPKNSSEVMWEEWEEDIKEG